MINFTVDAKIWKKDKYFHELLFCSELSSLIPDVVPKLDEFLRNPAISTISNPHELCKEKFKQKIEKFINWYENSYSTTLYYLLK